MDKKENKNWVAVSVYLNPKLAKKLKDKAQQEKRSISAQAQIILESSLQ